MRSRRDTLLALADNRRRRLDGEGRAVFSLTQDEIKKSTHTAMRLADASRSQAAARAGRQSPLSA